jgi:protocatechuate 3,4-dioxygenase, alpha subunit
VSAGGHSPSQTIGPFFGFALPWHEGPSVVAPGTPGAVLVEGRLLDGGSAPVPDGLIETWQLGPPGIRGFGRAATDAEGRYAILTLKPDPVPDASGAVHAPHLAVSVFARGLLKRVVTRIYFPDEPAANAVDPVLSAIADTVARATLVAARTDRGYRFDVRLQGHGEEGGEYRQETVFFDE